MRHAWLLIVFLFCSACMVREATDSPVVQTEFVFGLKGTSVLAYTDESSAVIMDVTFAKYVADERFRLNYLDALLRHDGACDGIRLKVDGMLVERHPSSGRLPVLSNLIVLEVAPSKDPQFNACQFGASDFM